MSAQRIEGPGMLGSLSLIRDLIDGPRRAHDEYGTIFKLNVGPAGSNVYFISEPQWIEQVLLTNRERYIKDRIFQWLRPIFGDGLLVSEGEKWKRNRRMMAPAFHRKRLLRHDVAMVDCAQAAVAGIRDGEVFSLNRAMMSLTLDVALRTLFGAELRDRASIVGDAVDDVLHYADSVVKIPGPIPTWLPFGPSVRLRRGMSALMGVVDELIAERRASGTKSDDLLGLLLAARDDDDQGLTDREVRDEVVTLLLAGHETTALLLTYAVMLLCRFPYALEPVLAELDEVLDGRRPTIADIRQLPRLTQVINETLRLYPPAGILGREAVEEDQLGTHQIHVGDQVTVSIWAMHHDARYFVDPWTFNPERWTKELEASLPRFAYMPFGGGQRVCIGESFAMIEAHLLLAELLQKLTFTLESDEEPELELAVTMRPTSDILARVRRRK